MKKLVLILLIGIVLISGCITKELTEKEKEEINKTIEELEKIGAEVEPNCTLGSISLISGYPKWEAGNIKAIVRASGAKLSNFTFAVILTNDTTAYFKDLTNASAEVGVQTTLISEQTGLEKAEISRLQILTNCPNVASLWITLY